MPKGAGPLTLWWLVTGWPSPPLLLGPGLLFRLVCVGRLGGWGRHLGGLRIRVTVGTRCPVRAREVGLSSKLRIMLYGKYLAFNI